MSDLARKKDTVKKVIRSLLLSAPSGLSLYQLEKDYLSVEHEELPYRVFGHTSVLDFAKTLPDVIRIQYHDRKVHLFAIADSSTKHIKEMVGRQRKTKGYLGLTSVAPSRPPRTKAMTSMTGMRSLPTHHVRSNVYRVIVKYSGGVSLTDFPHLYQEVNCVSLDVGRIGYKNLPDLLYSMPDVVKLEFGRRDRNGNNIYAFPVRPIHRKRRAAPDSKTADIADAKKAVENKSASVEARVGTSKVASEETMQYMKNAQSNEVTTQASLARQCNKVVMPPKPDSESSPFIRNLSKDQSTIVLCKDGDEHAEAKEVSSMLYYNAQNTRPPKQKSVSNAANNSTSKETPKIDPFRPLVMPACKVLQNEVMQVLSDKPEGTWAVRIPALYKRKFGKEMELKELGYFSIIDFLATLSDEVSITRPNPRGDWFLCKRNKDKPTSGIMAATINEDLEVTKLEIRELLVKAKDDGIPLSSLPDTYEKVFKHKIHFEEIGIPDTFHLILKIKGFCLHEKNGKVIASLTEEERQKLGWQAMGRKADTSEIPTDAVGPKGVFKQPTLPTISLQYFDVFVSDVTSPGNFAIQICGKKTTRALERLMDDLEQFYCSPAADLYKIPSRMICMGQICAAVFPVDMNWHRAVITALNGAGFVDVLYVDYGSIDSVPVTSIRFLRQCFLRLPSQMIKARLAHIQPKNLETWTLASRNCMLSLCRDRPLVAQVTDSVDDKLSLCICDTTDPEKDVHVNDALVTMKHAVFFPDGLPRNKHAELKKFYLDGMDVSDTEDDFPPPLCEMSDKSIDHPDGANAAPDTPEHLSVSQNISRTSDDIIHDQRVPEKDGSKECRVMPLAQYVKPYKILGGEYKFHIVDYEGKLMVTAAEISTLFNKPNVPLVQLLLVKNLKFNEVVIGSKEKHSILIEELEALEVPGVVSGKMKMVCLYLLDDVPAILRGLGHTKEAEISKELTSLIKCVNTAKRSSADPETVPKSLHDEETDLTNFLDATLRNLIGERNKLYKKRRELLDTLASDSSPCLVDEVENIEQKIVVVDEKIQGHPDRRAMQPEWERRDALMVRNLMKSQYNPKTTTGEVCDNQDVCSPGNRHSTEPTQASTAASTPQATATKVAEVAPYVRVTGGSPPVAEDLAEIPGAQIPHNVMSFSPRTDNMLVGPCTNTGCRTCPPLWPSQQVARPPIISPHRRDVGAGDSTATTSSVGHVVHGTIAHPHLKILPFSSHSPIPGAVGVGPPQIGYRCIPIAQNAGTQVCLDAMGRPTSISNFPPNHMLFGQPAQVTMQGSVPMPYYIPYSHAGVQ